MANDPPIIIDMVEALSAEDYPSITLWNRLEGRPHADDFSRALKAEVRDALWMIAKQWQMGEFLGDDAGSPSLAKIHIEITQLTKYQPDGHSTLPFPGNIPLETAVERRNLPIGLQGERVPLDLRLQIGRQWIKMMEKVNNSSPTLISAFIEKYPIPMPNPADEEDSLICAHSEVWAQFSAVAGRAMDGAALYAYILKKPGNHAYDGISVSSQMQNEINAAEKKFIAWIESLYAQPSEEDDAWDPSRLEYKFACSAPECNAEKVYVADEYYHGHLDWYNLDLDFTRKSLGVPTVSIPGTTQPLIQSFIPTAITFDGMPNTRWWTFEDGRTNFGDIKPDTTDPAKLLLIEFGLVYANDWFLFPLTLKTGSIAAIKGLAVTNAFGERFWIEAAGKGSDEEWQRWSMFTTSIKGNADIPAELSTLLLPTVPKIQESAPLEEVMLAKDEVANMVWGIETIVPLPDGRSKSGNEASNELTRHLQKLTNESIKKGAISQPEETVVAPLRYRLMNSVPENWIPFISVHVDGDIREVQLQRAAMPRVLNGDKNTPKIHPRTTLLRKGLEKNSKYFIHEEEVPRAGIYVTQSYQRARWHDGRVYAWLGVRKKTGRGESSSGLAFDQIVPVK